MIELERRENSRPSGDFYLYRWYVDGGRVNRAEAKRLAAAAREGRLTHSGFAGVVGPARIVVDSDA